MSKSFPKPEITLDGIYSKFADGNFCKKFLLDIRFMQARIDKKPLS